MLRNAAMFNRLARVGVHTFALTKGTATWAPSAGAIQFQTRAFSFDTAKLARMQNTDAQKSVDRVVDHQVASRESEFDALTPAARKYLTRVYGNAAAGMASIAAGSCLMLFTPLGASVSPLVPGLAAFVPLLALGMGYGQTQQAKLTMYHSFAALTGMGLSPVVASATLGGVLVPAVGLTGATFAGFSAAALMAPKGSSVKMQGPLLAGLIGLIGVQLLGMFYPTPLFMQLSMYGGLALFSLMVASDTGAMIERANAGCTDIVGDSINMLLNIVNIFTRIVHLLQNND